MTAAAFNAFQRLGAAASPFLGSVTLKMAGQAITVPSCQVKASSNDIAHEQYGDVLERTLKASPLKTELPRRPEPHTDLIIYDGREYKITSVKGDGPASPFWSITGTAAI